MVGLERCRIIELSLYNKVIIVSVITNIMMCIYVYTCISVSVVYIIRIMIIGSVYIMIN